MLQIRTRFMAALVLFSFSAGIGNAAQVSKSDRGAQPALPASSAAITALERQVPEMMAQARIPGISMALIRNGRIAWQHGFGVGSAETKTPVGDSTVFEAASLSKAVFAYCVLKMVDRGQIDLDVPLSKYLPEPYIPDDRVKLITARIVLSHTTGFPNWRPRGQALQIHFTPGDRFSYSGEGYMYLQKVVETIAGKPANDFMREMVFQPLGMVHSSYIWTEEYDRLSATGHDLLGAATPKGKPAQMRAAASLHTTAQDYARFVLAVMNGTGLAAGTARQMLTGQVKLDENCLDCTESKPAHLSETLSWGLGWGLERIGGTDYFWHWGDNGNFRCFVMASRQNHAGIVMFTNSFNGLSIVDHVLNLALGGKHPATSWVKYDQYDSPAGRLCAALARDGAERAIQWYLGERGKSGWPAPAENLVNQLGYAMLQTKKLDDAVRLFQWNVELFPNSANVYDSLAEAHAARGEKELAVRFYRKSLDLNPSNQNARDKLKELEKRGAVSPNSDFRELNLPELELGDTAPLPRKLEFGDTAPLGVSAPLGNPW